MKKWIFLGIGLVIGGGLGVLCTKKHYQDIAFHEISECRDLYKKKAAAAELARKNQEEKDKLMLKLEENSDFEAENDEKSASKMTKTGQTDTKNTKNKEYTSYINRYSGKNREEFNVFSNPPDENLIDNEDDSDGYFGGDDDDPYEIFVKHESPSEGLSEQPFMISEEEFAGEKLFYDKVMIEYYDDGIAVLEDTDEILDSIEDLIGPYILGKPIEDDTIYVRNDNRSTDYGIIFKGTNFVSEEDLR